MENLYDDYNDLLAENNLLHLELKKYEIPKIIYSSYQELETIKENCFNELKNFLIDIIKNKEFLIFYNEFKCPESLRLKIEYTLKTLLKVENDNDIKLLWIKNKTNEIINHINIFLQSMTVYPSQIISNENYLINIIYENIILQIKLFLNLVPLIKCNVCRKYCNIIDNQNICKFCFKYK